MAFSPACQTDSILTIELPFVNPIKLDLGFASETRAILRRTLEPRKKFDLIRLKEESDHSKSNGKTEWRSRRNTERTKKSTGEGSSDPPHTIQSDTESQFTRLLVSLTLSICFLFLNINI